MDYTEHPHASIDFNHSPHSAIIDGGQTPHERRAPAQPAGVVRATVRGCRRMIDVADLLGTPDEPLERGPGPPACASVSPRQKCRANSVASGSPLGVQLGRHVGIPPWGVWNAGRLQGRLQLPSRLLAAQITTNIHLQAALLPVHLDVQAGVVDADVLPPPSMCTPRFLSSRLRANRWSWLYRARSCAGAARLPRLRGGPVQSGAAIASIRRVVPHSCW